MAIKGNLGVSRILRTTGGENPGPGGLNETPGADGMVLVTMDRIDETNLYATDPGGVMTFFTKLQDASDRLLQDTKETALRNIVAQNGLCEESFPIDEASLAKAILRQVGEIPQPDNLQKCKMDILVYIFIACAISAIISDELISFKKRCFNIKKWDLATVEKILEKIQPISKRRFNTYRHPLPAKAVAGMHVNLLREALEQCNLSDIVGYIKNFTEDFFVIVNDTMSWATASLAIDRQEIEALFNATEFTAPTPTRERVGKSVRNVMGSVESQDQEPTIDPRVLARTMATIERLKDLEEAIGYYQDLFACSYFELLPTGDQMRSNYDFIKMASQGSNVPSSVDSDHDFTEDQLTPAYLKVKQAEAMELATSIKKAYKGFLKYYS